MRASKNLLKMSSAVSVRDTETLPLQWLSAYSAGCTLICSMTDNSWDTLRRMNSQLICSRESPGSKLKSIVMGIAQPGGIKHIDEAEIERA